MPIPKVIHQLWKDEDVPERYRTLRESWRRHNPGWTIRLWTDRELMELVEIHYPDLLDIYAGYHRPISRADLGRYLVLDHCGGLYADLDCECLQSIDPLVAGADFAIGVEPEEHVKRFELGHVICASLIASTAGHPFWRSVLDEVRASQADAEVLSQTGPLLLTRAVDNYSAKDELRLWPAAQVYPLSKYECWQGEAYDIEFWERATREAYVVHYWDGGWFRTSTAPPGLPYEVSVSVNAAPPRTEPEPRPKIACLMVSSGRLERAWPAVEAYLAQSYANRMLVIGAPEPEAALIRRLRDLERTDIRLVRLPASPAGVSLPAALLDAAEAEVVCLWDEDTVHDPRRLEIQQRIRHTTGARSSLLRRRLIWQPATGRLAVTAPAPAARSALTLKDALRSLAGRPASDADWLAALDGAGRAASLDMPRLMLWVEDGTDPAAAGRFETGFAAASTRFAPERTPIVLEQLATRMILPQGLGGAPAEPRAHRPRPARRVLLLTPVKNAHTHLRTYLHLLERLDAGGARLSIGFLDSDSGDGGHETLLAMVPALRQRFARVTVLKHDYGFHPTGPRWAPAIQRARREILARSRNRLLAGALRDEDWVLWLDADLADYPADLLTRLLASGRQIAVPYCARTDGTVFDMNTFRFSPDAGGRDDPKYLLDGLFQPPRGHGRLYLDAFQDRDEVQVDAVGGTALLVRADLHREGLSFPAHSYKGYIETEGLAMMARDMGVTAWGLPRLRITHTDD